MSDFHQAIMLTEINSSGKNLKVARLVPPRRDARALLGLQRNDVIDVMFDPETLGDPRREPIDRCHNAFLFLGKVARAIFLRLPPSRVKRIKQFAMVPVVNFPSTHYFISIFEIRLSLKFFTPFGILFAPITRFFASLFGIFVPPFRFLLSIVGSFPFGIELPTEFFKFPDSTTVFSSPPIAVIKASGPIFNRPEFTFLFLGLPFFRRYPAFDHSILRKLSVPPETVPISTGIPML